jgi:hypothetical protein
MEKTKTTKSAEVVEFKLKDASHLDPIMEYCGDCLREGVNCRYPDCLEETKDD